MTYTFESGTPDSSPSVAVGDYIDTITEVSVTVGTYDATGGSENIRVQDDCDGFDRYLVPLSDVLSGVSVNGFDLIAASLRLLDSTGTAFITDDLPTSPPNLADFNDFPSSFFGLGFESDLFPFFAKVSAEVTSIILVTCGNGTFDAGEECDDGNREDDDGCSSDCLVDPGFSCKFEPSICGICQGGTIPAIGNVGLGILIATVLAQAVGCFRVERGLGRRRRAVARLRRRRVVSKE